MSTPTTPETWLTQEAFDRLQEELAERSGRRREQIVKRIEAAREEGDLKENGGYHAAKEEQGKNEARIYKLSVRILGENDLFGETVTINHHFILVGTGRQIFNTDHPPLNSVFVFHRDSGLLLQELLPIDASGTDIFGSDVALGDTRALVGAANPEAWQALERAPHSSSPCRRKAPP